MPGVSPDVARALFATRPVAYLASCSGAGVPHIVPIVFVVNGSTIVTAVDRKPKSGRVLRRIRNIRENPSVAVLADRYTDDWSMLWWIRADGRARLMDGADPSAQRAWGALTARYPQYAGHPPAGMVIAIDVHRWSGWAASDAAIARATSAEPAWPEAGWPGTEVASVRSESRGLTPSAAQARELRIGGTSPGTDPGRSWP